MTGPRQQNNLVPENPSMKDLLDLHKKDVFLTLNCHAIGLVQSFKAADQTATVTINYKRTRFQLDPNAGAYLPVLIDYPIIVDAPVVFLGGGGASLTFPVAKGDECIVLFNDRDLDNWFNGSSGGAVATQRAHSFSDAMILVGIRSKANALQGFNTTDAEIKHGDVTVTFRPGGGVFITNSIGNFHFEDNADVSFDTGTVIGRFGNGGKVKFLNYPAFNPSGEDLLTTIINLFTTATVMVDGTPTPLTLSPTDLVALQSYKP